MKISKKLVFLPLILTLIAPGLTACSSQKTQKAIIFIDDATTEGRSLKGNLSIFGSSKDPIKYEIIEKATKAQSESKKTDKMNYNETCDNGNGCFYVDGKPLSEVEVTNYYEVEEGFETSLPVNENNQASLKVSDGKNSGEWLIPTSSSEQPIYLTILVTDFWVSVTELKNGKVTHTSVSVSKQSPENTWYFKELFKDDLSFYFERENPWVQFRLMYQKFSIAKSKANDETCKVFGKTCKGSASYTSIANAYRKAYDGTLTPMLNEFSTNNDNKDIAVALLKLEKLAELHADCYFRTYNAANDRNDNAYSATSECFSDVKQQESDLEIYLKEFSQELTTFMRSGYH
jgi:hypothetical protein